jgi:hypothetical protein
MNGYLGNPFGDVEIPGQKDKVWVRYMHSKNVGDIPQLRLTWATNKTVAPIFGLPVRLGFSLSGGMEVLGCYYSSQEVKLTYENIPISKSYHPE